MTSLSFKGPLDDPNQWDFSGAGTLGKIAVKHAKLPAVINLSGGTFNATPARLTVANAKVNLLDASLTVDGSVESPYQAPPSLEATAAGSIGADMTGWLAGQIEMPKQFMPRSPLQVTKSRVLWKKDGDVAFAGDLRVAGGPLTFLRPRSGASNPNSQRDPCRGRRAARPYDRCSQKR